MLNHKITHLLVLDQEQMVGVVSEHDWLFFQKRHPISLFRVIEEAETMEELASFRQEAFALIKHLFEEEGNAKRNWSKIYGNTSYKKLSTVKRSFVF